MRIMKQIQHQLTLHRSLEAELLEKTKNKKKSIDYLRKRLYYILIELYRSIKIRDVYKN